MLAAGLGQFGSSLTSQQAGSYPRQSQGGSTLRFVAVSLFLSKALPALKLAEQNFMSIITYAIHSFQCELFHFYDNHDIWHFLSATSLFLNFMMLLTIDDDLHLKPREQIPVF